ncbi:MAG: NAD(+) synthase [Spirochaetes bacterium]|nr:NAD(+) synthase [Spirochaetota bacterium]
MDNMGFIKIAAAIPMGKVADVEYNLDQHKKLIQQAEEQGIKILVFPELSLTSYTCGDLFFHQSLLEAAFAGLVTLAEQSKNSEMLIIVGLPIILQNNLYNCAAVINQGKILGIIPKTHVPNYREFYEIRWFTPYEHQSPLYFTHNGDEIPFHNRLIFKETDHPALQVGVEICEDFWHPIPPSSLLTQNGAIVICNLSASNVLVGKDDYRQLLVKSQSSRTISAYCYCSTGMGESTTDVVFDAAAYIYENGQCLTQSQRFLRENQLIVSDIDCEKLVNERIRMNTFSQRKDDISYIPFQLNIKEEADYQLKYPVYPYPFVPDHPEKLDLRCAEIFSIQSSALAKRLETLENSPAIIGLSGGLDSTLALLVTIKAYQLINSKISKIKAVTMPGFGTSQKTYQLVKKLCSLLQIQLQDLHIRDISKLLYKKIDHNIELQDTVYENIQARARTYLLMSIANQHNGLVIGTGDLSEIALGWSTYNGDHISMYNVNSSVPKTLVRFLINWVAEKEFSGKITEILKAITELPISPELLPPDGNKITQKTEDTIGPYELNDFFLFYFVRQGFSREKILYLAQIAFSTKYDKQEIEKWLNLFYHRFFTSQWKRDCVPAGPKIGSIDLSPRGSWRMPSEAAKNIFQ